MNVADFREILDDLQRLYAAAGAKIPANDMAALSDAMKSADEQTFETFLTSLKARLDHPAGKRAKGASGSTSSTHLSALESAGVDKAAFASAFAALEADKSLKGADLDKIGAAYTHFERFGKLYKSRAAKLKQIKQTFQDKREFESRGKVIDELIPWQ